MTQFFLQHSWWMPWYGLIGAVLTLPWSVGLVRRTGARPAVYINIFSTVLALIHSLVVLQGVWDKAPQRLLSPWLNVVDLDLTLSIEISPLSIGAVVLITGLSLLAQIYALGYLEKDWSLARFYGLMGFFEAAMSGIAVSDSLFLSYALLEMLTLSTYLLVGFWYAQPLVVTAARDAFWTKRVGDLLLLMGVVALSSISGSFNFSELAEWTKTAELSPQMATLLGLALIAGPIGKCAQFPLNLWLDEAMEGPNPASVLRNSVVVGCGAFVLIKLQPVLALSTVAQTTLVVLGAITAIGASLVAIAQVDIKRALSHTTSAYLGLIFIAVGLQRVDMALLLLFVHAVAKALLFMSVGSIILSTNTQTLTEMGGLWSRMPATTTAFVVGSAGLVALLPLGGFIAELEWMQLFESAPAILSVVLAVNALLSFNLVRVFALVFLRSPQAKTRRTPEVAWPMAVPMVSQSIITLLVPFILQTWHQPTLIEFSVLPVVLLAGSSTLGGLLAWFFYIRSTPTVEEPGKKVWRPLRNFLAYDFRVARVYELTVGFIVTQSSRLTYWFDRYIVDGLVNLVGLATIFSGEGLKYNVSGRYQFYMLTILLGLVVVGALINWSLM
jgi:NAD(P)H-quinone oxidoreductase subunit 5